MEKFCDLHTHSKFSDGTFTPTELIEEGERIGLAAVALTDHNTVAGVKELFSVAEGRKILPVAGVEIPTDYQGLELHIVGLFLPLDKLDRVTEFVEEYNRGKEKNNQELVARLREAGYDIDYAEIKRRQGAGHINRTHIATALIEKGYVGSVQESIQPNGILSKERGFYRAPKRLGALQTVEFYRAIGGRAVLAHPFLNMDESTLRAFIREAKEVGLVGMETEYPLFDEKTTALAKEIAREEGLCESGGSDFHGDKKPNIALGVGKGDLRVPLAFAEALKNRL